MPGLVNILQDQKPIVCIISWSLFKIFDSIIEPGSKSTQYVIPWTVKKPACDHSIIKSGQKLSTCTLSFNSPILIQVYYTLVSGLKTKQSGLQEIKHMSLIAVLFRINIINWGCISGGKVIVIQYVFISDFFLFTENLHLVSFCMYTCVSCNKEKNNCMWYTKHGRLHIYVSFS